MGLAPGQVREFSLTFTKAGTYDYVCLVHGVMMSGQVVVVGADQSVPSPAQAEADGKQQMAKGLAMVSEVMKEAESKVPPPTSNPDGSISYHIMLGYTKGEIDLMRFFPDNLVVHPGDTVEWFYGGSDAPHTVTFLNGATGADLVEVVPQPSGPPLLLINPELFFPSQAGQPLTRQGVFNSGLLTPALPFPAFSIKIGDITGLIQYECLIHDESGMQATLVVVPWKSGH